MNDYPGEVAEFLDLRGDCMNSILKQWGINDSCGEQITETAWEIGDKYVLKEYTDKKTLGLNELKQKQE